MSVLAWDGYPGDLKHVSLNPANVTEVVLNTLKGMPELMQQEVPICFFVRQGWLSLYCILYSEIAQKILQTPDWKEKDGMGEAATAVIDASNPLDPKMIDKLKRSWPQASTPDYKKALSEFAIAQVKTDLAAKNTAPLK